MHHNIYVYCHNDPTNRKDVSGKADIRFANSDDTDDWLSERTSGGFGGFNDYGVRVPDISSTYYSMKNVRTHECWWRNSIYNRTNNTVSQIQISQPLPYTLSRPSYAPGQVEQVWNNAKDPVTGIVRDPSGVEITWDRSLPRGSQWHMGHIPGQSYAVFHRLYMEQKMTKKEFLNWYRDPNNYRPELPHTNMSHRFE